MKFIRYQIERTAPQLGILNEEETRVYPLKAFETDYSTMEELIGTISEGEMQRLVYGCRLPFEQVNGAAPVEKAVILGKDAKNVPEERAKEYVFGYTIINDVSARNIQHPHKQWYFGKSRGCKNRCSC